MLGLPAAALGTHKHAGTCTYTHACARAGSATAATALQRAARPPGRGMREVRAAAQAAALAAVAAAAAAARRAGQQLWELAGTQHAQQEGRQLLGLEAQAQSRLWTPPLPPSRGLTRGQWHCVWEGGWGSRHASKRAVSCAPVLLPRGCCCANPAAVQALLPCPLTGTLLRHSSRSTRAPQHTWALIGALVALAEASKRCL